MEINVFFFFTLDGKTKRDLIVYRQDKGYYEPGIKI